MSNKINASPNYLWSFKKIERKEGGKKGGRVFVLVTGEREEEMGGKSSGTKCQQLVILKKRVERSSVYYILQLFYKFEMTPK